MNKINRPVWFTTYLALIAGVATAVVYHWSTWLTVSIAVASFGWAVFTDPKPRVRRGDFESCDCPQCEDVDDDTTWVKDC